MRLGPELSRAGPGVGAALRGSDDAHSRIAELLFAVALLGAVVLLLILQFPLGFRIDDWFFLRGRDWGSAFQPHFGHLLVVQVLLYRGLVEVFGTDSAVPWAVMSTLLFASAMAVVYVWLRERVGGWLALAGVLPVLVLGSASDDLLWQFEMGFSGSMACGVGAFLALDRKRYAWACALLVGSLAFSSLGICFLLAVAVRLAIERRKWWVAAIPAALYAIWWLIWDRGTSSQVTSDNLVHAPAYVLSGFASSFASWSGLVNHTALLGFSQDYGLRAGPAFPWYVVAAIAIVLVAWRFSIRLLPLLVLVGSFWFLGAARMTILFAAPIESRYQWMGVVFLLMLGAEALHGVRLRNEGIVAAFGVASVAVVLNLGLLLDNANRYESNLRIQTPPPQFRSSSP